MGTQLAGKWTLERLLGVGGMAAVYAARHRNGARAAIKVLHPELARVEEVRERFRREGYAANRVDHPGAVKVLDDDVVDEGPDVGTAFLVMELLEGESLQERVERAPPVGEGEFLRIAEGVLDVLEAAHRSGVVHRDLKPENLFLVRAEGAADRAPRVKVLDFGLARLADGQAITSHGLALGTPSFMSPEQAKGRVTEIDGRTDLFALGATGFRVRTGRRVHDAANAVELVTKMGTIPAPKIREVAPDVSRGYARVIDRALEFEREQRYPDAAAMREDVRRALAELEGSAQTVLAVLPASAVPPSQPPLPVVASAPRRRSTARSLAAWGALALALVVGVGVGGGAAWLERRAGPARVDLAPVASAPVAAPSSMDPLVRASAVASLPVAASAAPGDAGPGGGADAGVEAAVEVAPSARAPVPTRAPRGPAPSSASQPARPPARVGPGNVQPAPSKHRRKSGR